MRTIYAENLTHKAAVAFYGIAGQETTRPVYGTAYRLTSEDAASTWVIAVAGGAHVEVTNRTRVTVDYDPASIPNIKGLRRCHSCATTHLRRIRTDKIGSAHCDNQRSRDKAVQDQGFTNLTAKKATEAAAAREARIASASRLVEKSADTLRLATLRNLARDGQWARFSTMCATYGYTTTWAAEQIVARWGVVA